MKRIILVTVILLINIYYLKAQSIVGRNTDEEIYRIKTDTINDSSFVTKAYRKDSSMIYWIHLKSMNPENRNGRYVSFFPNKKIHCTGQYVNNIPFGDWKYYKVNGDIDTVLNYNGVIKSILTEEKGKVYIFPDKYPSFNGGGMDSFLLYIQKHFIYPDYALKRGMSGNVFIQFVVNDSGKIESPRVLGPIYNDLSMELFRVMDYAPRWQPAKVNGKPVCGQLNIQIMFNCINNTIDSIASDHSIASSEKIFISVEENATFQSGDINKFRTWVREHLQFPVSTLQKGLEGKVIVEFVVNSKGLIGRVRVYRGVDPIIDAAVVKAIWSSPPWKPARQGGNACNQQFVIPINFKLTR